MVTSALRRWRIRRLYNGQDFARARQLSEHELGGKNHAFALDIIVRSLYNQGHWQALLDVAARRREQQRAPCCLSPFDAPSQRARSLLMTRSSVFFSHLH